MLDPAAAYLFGRASRRERRGGLARRERRPAVGIEGFWHSADRHREACASAGLVIEEWREPAVKPATDQRAILVVRARR